MGLFRRLLRSLRKADEAKANKDSEKDVKPVVEAPSEDNGYVYEVGEKTIYDCIQESKALGFDMRLINDKLSSMEARAFISWFENYKKEQEE